MKVPYCTVCQTEFKSSRSLASHRYRFHRKDGKNEQIKIAGSKSEEIEHAINKIRKESDEAFKHVKEDIQELAYDTRLLWKRFTEAVKVIKSLQQDIDEIQDE